MLSRYGNIDYILKMNIEDGLELIKTAYLKQAEERLWQQWLAERPYFETFVSFEEYKKKALKTNIKTENNKNDIKKIIEEAEKIKNADTKRGGNS